jgi:uncharacterized protein
MTRSDRPNRKFPLPAGVERRRFLQFGGVLVLATAAGACSSVETGDESAADTTTEPPKGTTTIASVAGVGVIDRSAQLQSLYVKVRDNTRIAVDLWLPPAAKDATVPTVIRATRYQRAPVTKSGKAEENQNFEEAKQWSENGYALVLVDARGSGASFGKRTQELSDEEVRDYGDVLDWIGSQPWSNGRVGSYGVSYDGNTAEHMARNNSKHLVAIAPQFSDFDPYRQTIFPGGVYFAGFDQWLGLTQILDGIQGSIERFAEASGVDLATLQTQFAGAAPVDGPDGAALLKAAIEEHQANSTDPLDKVEFRDDPRWDAASVATHRADIEKSEVPILVQAGWHDAGTVAGTLERFSTFANPMDVWVGPWPHGGRRVIDPVATTPPAYPGIDLPSQFSTLVAFFDRYVKNGEKPTPGKRMQFVTLGANGWTETTVWPLPNVKDQSWYLASGALLDAAPAKPEIVELPTAPGTTGTGTRWFGQIGNDIDYSKWNDGAESRVAFTSKPFESAVKVCGFPVVTINVSTMAEDGVIIAYLEHVGPKGAVYLTEGTLRLSARGTTQPPLRTDQRLDRSFAKADRASMPKGEPTTIVFEMMPMSVEFAAGSALRVSFASSDTDNFRAYTPQGTPMSIHLGGKQSAVLTLPVRR